MMLISFVLSASFGYSQVNGTIRNCLTPKEINLNSSGEFSLKTSPKYLLVDTANNYLQLLKKSEEESVWYSIISEVEQNFSLTLNSLTPLDKYNFFLYESGPVEEFCNLLYLKQVTPVRANLYRGEELKTGLDTNSIISFDDSLYSDLIMYHTTFHKSIKLDPTKNYYLNVYHSKGDGCEHQVTFFSETDSIPIRAPIESCFNEPFVKIPVKPTPVWIANRDTIQPKSFKDVAPNQVKTLLSGIALDSLSGEPIVADLTISSSMTGEKYDFITDETGVFDVPVFIGTKYFITITSLGYRSKKASVVVPEKPIEFSFLLTTKGKGETFNLNNIFFHPSTYAFKETSVPELEKLLNYMHKHPSISIKVVGHTNGKGKVKGKSDLAYLGEGWTFEGNEVKLSKYRAEAVRLYLVGKGIDKDRITSDGKGAEEMLYPFPKNQWEKDQNKRVEIFIE